MHLDVKRVAYLMAAASMRRTKETERLSQYHYTYRHGWPHYDRVTKWKIYLSIE